MENYLLFRGCVGLLGSDCESKRLVRKLCTATTVKYVTYSDSVYFIGLPEDRRIILGVK
jgi:hypothetical protein